MNRKSLAGLVSIAMVSMLVAPSAYAYNSEGSVTLGGGGSVSANVTFNAIMVAQGTDPAAAATLDFGSGGNAFRDSEEAVEITVDTNVAGNLVIIYTSNSAAGASPQYTGDPATGQDGGGLVGVSDSSQTVPMAWIMNDDNDDAVFDGTLDGTGETFFTDAAHSATFTTVNGTLDNQAMENCATNTPVTNTPGDGLYPQFFGADGLVSQDLCAAGTDNVVSQELSKNIAVVAFGFNGAVGNTVSSQVTSPIYVALGADFTNAAAQAYSTNQLQVELITQ